MSIDALFAPEAHGDVARRFDWLRDRCQRMEDLDLADNAIEAVLSVLTEHLAASPDSLRKACQHSTRRELIIPFGGTGDAALYEIANPPAVAVRHQREENYD